MAVYHSSVMDESVTDEKKVWEGLFADLGELIAIYHTQGNRRMKRQLLFDFDTIREDIPCDRHLALSAGCGAVVGGTI